MSRQDFEIIELFGEAGPCQGGGQGVIRRYGATVGASRCRHWQELFGDKNRGLPMLARGCAVGVRYGELAQALGPREPGWNARLPCWGRTAEQGARPCAQYSPLPDAEVEAAKDRLTKILDAIPDLVTQIQATLTVDGVAEGKTPCPVCRVGTVAWVYERRIGGRRQYCQGVCSTPDCVRWLT